MFVRFRTMLAVSAFTLLVAIHVNAGCTATVTASTSDHDSTLTWGWGVTSSCSSVGRVTWEKWLDGVFQSANYCDNLPCGQPPTSSGITCQTPGTHEIRMRVWTDTFCGPPATDYCEGTATYTIAPSTSISAGPPSNPHFDSYGTFVYDMTFNFAFENVWPHYVEARLLPTETTSGGGGTNFNTALWSGSMTQSIAPSGARYGEVWANSCNPAWRRTSVFKLPEAPDNKCHSCPQCAPNPVRVSSGTMSYAENIPLQSIAGASLSMAYDNRTTTSAALGVGWGTLFKSWLRTMAEPDGSTTVVIGVDNETYIFSNSGGVYLQIWPTSSSLPAVLRYDSASASYAVREPGSDIETYYRASDGRVTRRRSVSTGREAAFTYDGSGRPTRIADSWGNVAWNITTNATTGFIDSIAVEGTSIVWNYLYDASGNLLSINVGTTPWRTYSYGSAGMTEARDGAGNLIESHQYDASGAATNSIGPGGDIASFTYNGAGRVAGETVTTTVSSAGASTNYYSRYVGGEQRTVQVDGVCSGCGTKNGVYGFDDAGHVIREQLARGYVTLQAYDYAGRIVTKSGPYAPSGCDPDNDAYHCRLTPDSILSTNLTSYPITSTTNYIYGDVLWPDRPTAITTDSILQPGGVKTESFVYDSISGIALQHTVTGYTGSPATLTSRMTTTALYDGTEGPAFNPGGSYNSAWLTLPQPSHLRKTIDGPRTDVTDVTSFVYYPVDNSVTATWRGQLAAMKNAAGHITHYENYDVFGNAGRIIDPNGVATETSFDSLGRVLTATIKGASGCDTVADPLCATDLTTSRAYQVTTGPLASQTDASGNVTAYEYDPRGRVSAISRGPSSTDLRERIEYTYDAASGQKSLERYLAMSGGSWVEKKSDSFHYDSEARLSDATHPDLTSIAYSYNLAGNVTGIRDEDHPGPNTLYLYDPAGSLSVVTQTLGADTVSTSYAYDKSGDLTTVTDPNGNITSYTYDDFGQMLTQVSPVTGTTTYAYDSAGNLTSTTDANGAVTTRTYDVLGRILTSAATVGSSSESTSWSYDRAVPFGLGRLGLMTDAAGTATYSYDRRGLLLSDSRTTGSILLATSFQYDATGNRTRQTFPDGAPIVYTYDFAGRPLSLSAFGVTYVSGATYLPFGPETSLSFANGTTQTRVYDQRFRIQRNTLNGPAGTIADYAYSEDNVGNILSIHDMLDSTYDRDFVYDDLNRLTTANSGASLWGAGSYHYDSMGNLLSRDLGGSVEVDPNDPLSRTRRFSSASDSLPAPGSIHETYGYTGTTSLLATVTSAGIDHPITYDPAGNEIRYFDPRTYSPRNLMSSITEPSEDDRSHTVTYTYDGRGVRLIRSEGTTGYATPFANRYYVYSPELHLTAVSVDDNPNIWGKSAISNFVPAMKSEIAWFNDRPVAQLIDGSTIRYTFTDHLGTPILQTDPNALVAWRAEYEPYGDLWTLRAGTAAEQPLRFPGQEYERRWEGTEERYNIFRWYRAGWGRYTQQDPLGIGGIGLWRGARYSRWTGPYRYQAIADTVRRTAASLSDANGYVYAGADPIINSDPLGLEPAKCEIWTLYPKPVAGLCAYVGE